MHRVKLQVSLASPAADVWKTVGPFGNFAKWHPMIQKSEVSGDGKIRTLTMPDGSTSQERLIGHDDNAMQYRYTMHGESSLPVTDFTGTVTAMALGERTLFTWEATFDVVPGAPADQVVGMLQQRIFDSAGPQLKELFGG